MKKFKHPCFWGHEDGEIVEYGNTNCVKRCPRCGEGYFLIDNSLPGKFILFTFLVAAVIVACAHIFNWEWFLA